MFANGLVITAQRVVFTLCHFSMLVHIPRSCYHFKSSIISLSFYAIFNKGSKILGNSEI